VNTRDDKIMVINRNSDLSFTELQIPGCRNTWKNPREKRLLTAGKNANRITEYHACFCGKRGSVFIGLTSSPGETDCSVTRAAGLAANE
jgi:hypothetical protein